MSTEPLDQQAVTKAPGRRWYQYGLRTLMLGVLICSLACGWLAVKLERAKRQREAVAGVRTVDYCDVGYEYDPDSPNPDLERILFGWPAPPRSTWIENFLGVDFFHQAVTAHIDRNHVDEVIPHLLRLPHLRKVYIGACDEEECEAAFRKLRPRLPDVSIDPAYPHGVEYSYVPVVG